MVAIAPVFAGASRRLMGCFDLMDSKTRFDTYSEVAKTHLS